MKDDISQGVSLSTKGSKLAHWEQWVVLKKKVNIYAVFMKIRLDRIPQATKSKQWKYALDAVCSRQTTHFPGTNIISLSWLYLWALRLFLRIQYIGWRTKIPHAKMINRSEFLINLEIQILRQKSYHKSVELFVSFIANTVSELIRFVSSFS